MDPWLLEFENWETDEEETVAYAQHFMIKFLPHLPLDIKAIILRKYWHHRYKDALPFGIVNTP